MVSVNRSHERIESIGLEREVAAQPGAGIDGGEFEASVASALAAGLGSILDAIETGSLKASYDTIMQINKMAKEFTKLADLLNQISAGTGDPKQIYDEMKKIIGEKGDDPTGLWAMLAEVAGDTGNRETDSIKEKLVEQLDMVQSFIENPLASFMTGMTDDLNKLMEMFALLRGEDIDEEWIYGDDLTEFSKGHTWAIPYALAQNIKRAAEQFGYRLGLTDEDPAYDFLDDEIVTQFQTLVANVEARMDTLERMRELVITKVFEDGSEELQAFDGIMNDWKGMWHDLGGIYYEKHEGEVGSIVDEVGSWFGGDSPKVKLKDIIHDKKKLSQFLGRLVADHTIHHLSGFWSDQHNNDAARLKEKIEGFSAIATGPEGIALLAEIARKDENHAEKQSLFAGVWATFNDAVNKTSDSSSMLTSLRTEFETMSESAMVRFQALLEEMRAVIGEASRDVDKTVGAAKKDIRASKNWRQ